MHEHAAFGESPLGRADEKGSWGGEGLDFYFGDRAPVNWFGVFVTAIDLGPMWSPTLTCSGSGCHGSLKIAHWKRPRSRRGFSRTDDESLEGADVAVLAGQDA